jgi:hypothetical protein
MIRGYIDALTSLGFVEGWAYDPEAPAKAVTVSVCRVEDEVAWGLAHRFRPDLLDASYGLGWCAFKLRLDRPLAEGGSGSWRLRERATGAEICEVSNLATIEDPEASAPRPTDWTAIADPTVLDGVWQLKKCEFLLADFIAEQGIDRFLSVAYGYMLGRPVDESSLALHTRALRQATLSPLDILKELEQSAEFRGQPRRLAAPNSYCFPFIAP